MMVMDWPNLPREQWVDVMSHNGIDVETRRAKLARASAAVILAAGSDGAIRQPAMLELVLASVSSAAASTPTMRGELAPRLLAQDVRRKLGIEMPRGKWWFVDPDLPGRIRFLAAYGLMSPANASSIGDLPAGSMSLEEFLRSPVRDGPPPVAGPVVDRGTPVVDVVLPEAPATTDGVEWDGWSPEPRFGTPRRPERECRIDAYEDIATRLGIRLQPWQRRVLSVGSEFGADGLPAYSDVTITVGRQAGKSIVTLMVILELLLREPGTEVAYVAASERDAIKLWEGSIRTLLINSGLWRSAGLRLKKGAGNAGLYVDGPHRAGDPDIPLSVCHILSGSKAAGHGLTLRACVQDEIWSYRSDDHEKALHPAMRRFDDRQMWSISTMGDESSTYMHDRIERLRQTCMDEATSSALFEWSAPSDADITDEKVWWDALPSIGRMVSLRSLRQDLERNPHDFRRSTLNQMPGGDAAARGVFPESAWNAVCDLRTRIPNDFGGPVWVAVDCGPHENDTAVAMSDGSAVGLIAYEKGTDWVADFLERVLQTVDAQSVWAASFGARVQAGTACSRTEFEGLVVPSTPDLGLACARLEQDVLTGRVRVCETSALTAAMLAAEKKILRERGWTYTRRDDSIQMDLAPLWAVTMCWHAARTVLDKPEPEYAPPMILGRV